MEYKILKDLPEVCQKTLNQWKHEYVINIISMCPVGNANSIAILLTRIRKD